MKTNPNKLWIIVLALGWLFDFLFWKKAPADLSRLCTRSTADFILVRTKVLPHSG
ncbi:MAG: hypothetical protein ACYC6R_15885 [Anaerolineales bacterium]